MGMLLTMVMPIMVMPINADPDMIGEHCFDCTWQWAWEYIQANSK